MENTKIIRIYSCDYNIYNQIYVMNVEVLDLLDKSQDKIYLCCIPVVNAKTVEEVKSYIEKEIALQQENYTPDFTGIEWSSSNL